MIRENWPVTTEDYSQLGALNQLQGAEGPKSFRQVGTKMTHSQPKERREDVNEPLLTRSEARDDFLRCNVTGDECWVCYFQPETER